MIRTTLDNRDSLPTPFDVLDRFAKDLDIVLEDSDTSVASTAEQTPNGIGVMAVVNVQDAVWSGPLGNLPTNGADSALGLFQGVPLSERDSVLLSETVVAHKGLVLGMPLTVSFPLKGSTLRALPGSPLTSPQRDQTDPSPSPPGPNLNARSTNRAGGQSTISIYVTESVTNGGFFGRLSCTPPRPLVDLDPSNSAFGAISGSHHLIDVSNDVVISSRSMPLQIEDRLPLDQTSGSDCLLRYRGLASTPTKTEAPRVSVSLHTKG